MKNVIKKISFAVSILSCMSIYASHCLLASTSISPPEQKVLQRFDLPGTNYHHNGLSLITFSQCAIKPRHKHTGAEVAYVIKGEIHLHFDNNNVETVIHEGKSFQIPPNAYHITQAGKQGAVVLAAWVLK